MSETRSLQAIVSFDATIVGAAFAGLYMLHRLRGLAFFALGSLACCLIPTVSFATSGGNGYSYSRTITLAHAKVPNTDQSNFPVLFNTTDALLKTTANGGHVTSANGYDIIFTSDATGTQKLNHEIESYNATTGQFITWVQVPTVSHSTDTVIYLFYGNSSVTTSQENKTAVWDSSYKGVWHLPNGATLTTKDSTANANNSTAQTATAVAGEIDGGANFSGSQKVTLPNIALTTGFTLEAWINAAAYVYGGRIIAKAYTVNTSPWESYALALDYPATDHKISLKVDIGGRSVGVLSASTISLHTWYHLVGAYDGSNIKIYLNGSLDNSAALTGTLDTVSQVTEIGRNTVFDPQDWSGMIDEVRISGMARSPDWITTEYNNQSNPGTFYTLGSESNVGQGGTAPTVTSVSPNSGSTAGGTAVTITGTNFFSGATVTFGTAAATNVVVVSSTSITATTPVGSAGVVTVTVTVSGQSGSLSSGFTYISTLATPTFSPVAGSYSSAQSVTIHLPSGSTGCYIADGSTPAATTPGTCSHGTIYSTAVTVSSSLTLKAIATETGFINSGVASAAYTISTCAQNLVIGTYTLCGEAYNVITSGTHVTTTYSPSPGNGIIAWATWCYNSLCNGSISGITATIGDNVNATESCFAASPHSPFVTDANGGAQGSGDFQEHYVWYCPSIPSGVTSFTVTPSNPSLSFLQLQVSEWKTGSLAASCSPISNCFENVDNLGQAGNTTGGTTATITTSGPTVNANDLIWVGTQIPCCTFTGAAGTGYTGITVAPSSNPGMVNEAKAVTAVGTQTATTTWIGGSTPWFGVIVPIIGAGSPAPTVTSVSPNSGSTGGGTAVTITGTNFATGATVTFGTGTATAVSVVNSTTITATTPAESAGAVTVTVTVSGQSGSLTNGFTYTSPGGNGYSYTRSITIAHAKVPNTDQSNFPVLFNTADALLQSTANGGHVTSANGFDIIFTSDAAGTTKLNHEIESYNPATGQFIAWVQVPALSHTTDTVIYLYYGNSSITTSQENKTAVWSGNYKTVYHMADNAANATVNDSTGSNNGTAQANTSSKTIAGKIGSALSFNGSSDYVTVPQNGNFNLHAGPLTVETWIKDDSSAATLATFHRLVSWNDGTNSIQLGFGQDSTATLRSFYLMNASASSPPNISSIGNAPAGLNHVAATFDGSAYHIYLNGVSADGGSLKPGNVTAFTGNTTSLYLGQRGDGNTATYVNGVLDETRISSIARSADWIATEYNNQSNPGTFYTLGSESNVGQGGTAPTVTSVSPNSGSTAGGTAVTITGTNFFSGATVTFGTAAATNVVVVSSTSITATTPVGSAGVVTVTVTVSGQSGSLSSGFTYISTLATPTFSPVAGSYSSAQSVTIHLPSGSTGCYTADGSTPAATTPGTCSHGTIYSTAVTVSSSLTLKAIATETGFINSGVASAAYTISTCAQNLVIGTYTLCGEAYNVITSGTHVTTTYSPSPGNGIIAWATWCYNSLCNGSISGITATIGDNVNATESCFAASPHSPFVTDANGGAQGSGDFQEHYVWYCPSIPSGVTSFTVTPSNPSLSFLQLQVSEWKTGSLAASCSPISNCFENVDNLGQAGNTTGGTTATITTSGPTVNANDLIWVGTQIPCCTFTGAAGTGYTGITVAPSSNPGMVNEAKAVTAVGTQTATTTWIGGSTPWFGVIVPIIGAGSPAPTVTNVSPNSGSTGGGTAVSSNGLNTVTLSMPSHSQVLSAIETVNNYWIANNTPGNSDWTQATYFTGDLAAYNATGQSNYLTFAQSWASEHSYSLDSGNMTNYPNYQAAGQVYISLYQLNPVASDIAGITKSINGMVTSLNNSGVDDEWTWIDAINMSMPDFVELAAINNDTTYDSAMYSFYSYTKYQLGLYNPTTGLWWENSTYADTSTYWSRGNGSVFAAHAKVLAVLPTKDPHYAEYRSTFIGMAQALAARQQPGGYWNSDLGGTDYAGPESSGTAFFLYGFVWGVNNGILDPGTYTPVIANAWNFFVNTAIQPSGLLGYVQPAGSAPGPTTATTTEDFGVGAFLLAAQQMALLTN